MAVVHYALILAFATTILRAYFKGVFNKGGPGRFMGSQFKGLRLTAGRRPKGKGRRSRFAYVGPMFAYVGLC